MKIILHKVIEAIAKVVAATAQLVRTFGGQNDAGVYVVAIVTTVSGTALCWHMFDLLAAR